MAKTSMALAALTILLFTTQAFSEPYSLMLPKDFETAPKKLTCEREQPTSIYMKLYKHAKRNSWKVVVERKDVIYEFE